MAERLAAARAGDRPRGHAGTSDTERAIFAATERLLADVAFHELSVAQIIAAAEISRATFYFYFSSKFAVLAGLLAQTTDEIFDQIQPFVNRAEGVSPIEAMRTSLVATIMLWHKHRPALSAVHEHWNETPELRLLWTGVVSRFTDAIAAEIERERDTGLAAPGPPARALAAALLWGTDRCLYVAGLGVDADLPSEEALLGALLAIWSGSIGDRPAAS